MEHPRRCPGPVAGKSCGAFLLKPEVDPHSRCSSCRGKVCSPTATCSECEPWGEIQWVLYGTKKKSAKKSPKKATASSVLVSPDASSERGSLPSSPTQSRGRGRSAAGKRPIVLPKESELPVGEASDVLQACVGPEGSAGECVGDEVLVPAGPVSTEDPMWGKSPFRLEEEFDHWIVRKNVPRSPPAPSATLPPVFMQPAETEVRHGVTPAELDASGGSADSLSSSSSSSSVDSSSEDDSRSARRKRERSRKKKSRSRSRQKKKSRPSKKKAKRSKSKDWVSITVPRSKLLKVTTAAAASGWLPRTSSSPSLPSCSSYGQEPHRGRPFQAPRDPPKLTKASAAPTLRREALRQVEGVTPAAGSLADFIKLQGRPSARDIPTDTRMPAGQGNPMTYTFASVGPPVTQAGPSNVALPTVTDDTRAEGRVTEALVEGGECSSDEISSYRKVLALIRRHHRLDEPMPTTEQTWLSGLSSLVENPIQQKPSLLYS
ncbi:nucleolar and coiled-body phosphoprotein 1-like [Palaemon carinicauda]|uniref:nucleolar and coiled-body phosphoprotein 1-like n=1 Tax=Palaemon carinicauda TaxID=392227 RepID=UPI0035B64959